MICQPPASRQHVRPGPLARVWAAGGMAVSRRLRPGQREDRRCGTPWLRSFLRYSGYLSTLLTALFIVVSLLSIRAQYSLQKEEKLRQVMIQDLPKDFVINTRHSRGSSFFSESALCSPADIMLQLFSLDEGFIGFPCVTQQPESIAFVVPYIGILWIDFNSFVQCLNSILQFA